MIDCRVSFIAQATSSWGGLKNTLKKSEVQPPTKHELSCICVESDWSFPL